MSKFRLILNIIFFPVTLWGAVQFYHGTAQVVSDLEFHRPFFLLLIMVGISVIFFINLKWVTALVQKWIKYKEKTSLEGQLQSLTDDVYNLSHMELELGKSVKDELEIRYANPRELMLAEYVIKELNRICGMKLPKIFNYPTYFLAISTFVDRGNVSEVKKISCQFFR